MKLSLLLLVLPLLAEDKPAPPPITPEQQVKLLLAQVASKEARIATMQAQLQYFQMREVSRAAEDRARGAEQIVREQQAKEAKAAIDQLNAALDKADKAEVAAVEELRKLTGAPDKCRVTSTAEWECPKEDKK